jgi:hypothetical protein
MPCHHRLEEWLYDYLDAAGIADDLGGPLFRSARTVGVLYVVMERLLASAESTSRAQA